MATHENVPVLLEEQSFLMRVNRARLKSIDFPQMGPGEILALPLELEYRGSDIVLLEGFYLAPLNQDLYLGSDTSERDLDTVLSWADLFTTDDSDVATYVGLWLSQLDAESNTFVSTQFKSGQGDSATTLIRYVGHEGGVVGPDKKINIWIHLRTPRADIRQIKSALVNNIDLRIGYTVVPPRLLGFVDGGWSNG